MKLQTYKVSRITNQALLVSSIITFAYNAYKGNKELMVANVANIVSNYMSIKHLDKKFQSELENEIRAALLGE